MPTQEKEQKYKNSWTLNCKLHLKLHRNQEEAKLICITNIVGLNKQQ